MSKTICFTACVLQRFEVNTKGKTFSVGFFLRFYIFVEIPCNDHENKNKIEDSRHIIESANWRRYQKGFFFCFLDVFFFRQCRGMQGKESGGKESGGREEARGRRINCEYWAKFFLGLIKIIPKNFNIIKAVEQLSLRKKRHLVTSFFNKTLNCYFPMKIIILKIPQAQEKKFFSFNYMK